VNLILVLNLVPVVSGGAFGPLRSDGLQLLDLFKLGDEAIAKQVRQAPLTEAHVAFQCGHLNHAHAAIAPALSSGDLEPTGRVLAAGILLSMGKTEEGIELSRRYLDANDYTNAERAMLMNNLACGLLDSSAGVVSPARLAEADELTARAMDVLPMMNAVRATRACALIEKGAYRDACRLLSDKRFRLEPPWIRAGIKAALALALAGQGRTDAADTALRDAMRLDPDSAAVKQARERVARMSRARETEVASADT
jgi:predicted Zn-dependent protease